MIKVSSVVVVLVLSALADSQKLVDFMGPLHLELHQNDCNGKAAICAGTLAYRKCVPNADGEMVPYGLFIPCPVNTTCLNSENICVPNTTELSDDLSNEKLTATTAEVLTVSNANVNEFKNNDIDTTEKMVNDSSVDTVTTNDFTNNDNSNYTADAKVTESTKKVSDNAENSVVFYDNADLNNEETKEVNHKLVESSVFIDEMVNDSNDSATVLRTNDSTIINLNKSEGSDVSGVTADMTTKDTTTNNKGVEPSVQSVEMPNHSSDSVSAASTYDAASVNVGAESLYVSDVTADLTQEENAANEKSVEPPVHTEEIINDAPDPVSTAITDNVAKVNNDVESLGVSEVTAGLSQEENVENNVELSIHTEEMVNDTPYSVSATSADDAANVNIGAESLDVSDTTADWNQEKNVANEKNDESSVHTEEMADNAPDSISANGDAANVNIGAGSLDESDATSNFTQEDTAANEKYVELSGHTVEIVNDSSESVHLENTNNSANVNPDKPGDSDVSDITVDLTQEEFVTNKYNVEPSVHTEEMVAYSTNYFSEVSTDNTATVNFGAGVSDLHDVSVDLTHDEIAPNYTVEPSNEMVNESTECVNVVNTNDSANVNLASRDSYVSDATHVTQEKTAANENSVELYVHAEDMANDFTDTADSTNDAAYDYHDGMVKLDKSSPTTDLTDAETSANNKEVEMTVSTDDDSNNSVDVAKTNLNIGNTKDSVAYGVISDLIEEENASNKESMEPSTSTKEMVNDLIKNVAGSNAQDSSYEESDFTKKLDISNLTTNSTNDESNKHFAPFSTVKEVLSDSAMDISKSYSKNANSTNEPDDSIYEGSLQNKKHLEQRFITSETTKSENTLPNSEESDEELTDSGIVKVSKTVEVNKNINVMNWQNMYYQYYWKALGDHYKRLGMYFREREQQRRKEMQEEPQKLFEQRSKLAKGMMRTIKEIECKYEEIDNVYPDMKNCKKYYRCINKSNELKLVHLRCDNHKEFDWISLKCVYRYKAFCLGRNRY